MKRTITLLITQIVCATAIMAQVAINADNSDANSSAMLDVKSTSKGVLIPRVTLDDVNTAAPVTDPAEGLLVYNQSGSQAKGFYYWTGSKWQLVGETNSCEVFGNPAIVGEGNSTATSIEVCTGASLSLSSSTNGKWDNSGPTYSWTGPNSYTSTAADPGEVTASFDNVTHAGDYIVTITNGIAGTCSYSDTVTVFGSESTPATPGAITGNTTVCENATESYSIEAVANASSYNWTVPTGTTIQSGQGTTSISVVVGNTNGNISVRAESTCNGNSAYNDLAIIVNLYTTITGQPQDANAMNNGTADFEVTVTNANTYQWQENQGSGFVNVSNGGIYSGATTANLSISNVSGMDDYRYKCVITGDCNNATTDDATLHILSTVNNPGTGEDWLDRNLGASQVATASDDNLAYGYYFQWGRAADGHQLTDSDTISTKATTSTPNEGNPWDAKFIMYGTPPSENLDWLDTNDDNLWQGVNGVNNPCPSGCRLPTESEWLNEINSWDSEDCAGAYASPLKLTSAGYRHPSSTEKFDFNNQGSEGRYPSSTVGTSHWFKGLLFTSGLAMEDSNFHRIRGYTVRCIVD